MRRRFRAWRRWWSMRPRRRPGGIAAGAVTAGKLQAEAVTARKIAAGSSGWLN